MSSPLFVASCTLAIWIQEVAAYKSHGSHVIAVRMNSLQQGGLSKVVILFCNSPVPHQTCPDRTTSPPLMPVWAGYHAHGPLLTPTTQCGTTKVFCHTYFSNVVLECQTVQFSVRVHVNTRTASITHFIISLYYGISVGPFLLGQL